MKLYCTRDADGTKTIWSHMPRQNENGIWYLHAPESVPNDVYSEADFYGVIACEFFSYHRGMLSNLFPKGVKRGECVIVWVPRFEVFK